MDELGREGLEVVFENGIDDVGIGLFVVIGILFVCEVVLEFVFVQQGGYGIDDVVGIGVDQLYGVCGYGFGVFGDVVYDQYWFV